MFVCLFLMKALFNACLAILLSDAQWKWESKIQAYTASKPVDVHTKSEKIIWRNNFFDFNHFSGLQDFSGPPKEDTFLNREVSQLRCDQLAPTTQINSCNNPYTSAFKQSNYTRCIYKPFVQYKWLLHMQLLWFIKLGAFHHKQNLWDCQIHGHENAIRVNTCCAVGSLDSPDTSSILQEHSLCI